MGITVREALNIGGLKGARVIAGGEGVERKIEYVTVMEVPDIIQWLKGKELILTSGFAFTKKEIDQAKLISQLAAKGSAAIAIKSQRFFDTIPQVMIEAANQNKLPLIEFDRDVPYLDIINPIMIEIINKDSAKFEAIHRKLTEIAANSRELNQTVKRVAALIKNPVAVVSKDGRVLATDQAKWFQSSSIKKCIGKENALLKEPRKIKADKEYYVFPLMAEGTVEGYLIIAQVKNSIDEVVLMEVKNHLTVIILELIRRKTLYDFKRSLRNCFIEDLLLGHIKSEAVAKQRAGMFEIPVDYYKAVVVVNTNMDEENLIKVTERLEKSLIRKGYTGIFTLFENRIVILLILQDFDYKKLRDFLGELKKTADFLCSNPVSTGVGEIFPRFLDTQLSYHQAVEALEFGCKVWGKDACTMFSDIGVYRLLYSFPEDHNLENYLPKGLKILKEYDQENATELSKTLEVFLKNAGNSRKTADELFIHYKTLKYRLKRIEEITGLDLSSGEVRLELHLGLKIMEVLNRRRKE